MAKPEPTVGRDKPAHEWIYEALDEVERYEFPFGVDENKPRDQFQEELRAAAAERLDGLVRSIAIAYAVDVVTDVVRDLGERYVMAVNAVLCAPPGSTDVERWRGHAESARTIAEWWQRKFDLDPSLCAFGTAEWREANGVYGKEYLASLPRNVPDTALVLAPEGFDDDEEGV